MANINADNESAAKTEPVPEMKLHEKKLTEQIKMVNRIAEALLTAKEDNMMESLMSGMGIVGQHFDLDRVQIWRNEMVEDELHFVMRYEWLSEAGKERIEVPLGLSCPYSGVPGWYEMFLRGECINGPISQLKPSEEAFLGYYEMVSILCLPLFIEDELIGFFSVDDCRYERTFSKDELDIFYSVGLMFASSFNNYLQSKRLEETNEQLKEALQRALMTEIAEANSKAKSAFLARMSHEIRTPITAVIGISEIELQNPTSPPPIVESFARIHNSAKSLLGIVNDILDLSKIESGKMELAQEEYEVASMIVDVSQIHHAFTGSREIQFNMRVDENIPKRLIGDSLRIVQMINNALSNAFKYTLEGSVTLSLTCTRNEQNKDFVTLVLTIKDSGLGMTEEQLGNLSEEYTRHHEQEYRLIEGTGLGIPIIFNLAKMMNAEIKIDSEVGVGTNVIINIPQKVASDDVLGKETASRIEQHKEAAIVAGERFSFEPEPMPYGKVLIVDDVETNLFVAKGLMAFYDLNIETCESGYDAISKIKNNNVYDIVFMDYMMPGIDGAETMHKMREFGYTHPIVALTANAMIGQAEEFLREGFDGFVSKPIQTKQLNNALIKYIKDKQPPEVIEAARAESAKKAAKKGNINNFYKDPAFISKLRTGFKRSNKDAYANLSKALVMGDIKVAHRIAHTIKGAAYHIFESDLAEIAEKIERILEKKKKPPGKILSALESEITRVLDSIEEPDTEPVAESNQLSLEKASELLDKIAPMLEMQKTECMLLLSELRKIDGSNTLCRQIEEFDFREASKSLSKLKDKMISTV